jgi:hypothetical protein
MEENDSSAVLLQLINLDLNKRFFNPFLLTPHPIITLPPTEVSEKIHFLPNTVDLPSIESLETSNESPHIVTY